MENVSLRVLNVEELELIQGGLKGSDVAACVADAYTNHGWASVGLFVATAFEPWGAAFTTAACIGKNA